MRYVNGQGVVDDKGCWLSSLSSNRIFPVIGKNGSPLLQPGSSMDLTGFGTCMVDRSPATFKVKSVTGNVSFNCDEYWSVLRKRPGNYSTIYEQDSSVWKLGLEDWIRQNYPNSNGDEFWLFPTPTCDVLKDNIGNGSNPATVMGYTTIDDGTSGAPKSRAVQVLGVKRFAVTVIIHSNSLMTQTALEHNFLWDFSGAQSRDVFVPWYESMIDGDANIYPLGLKAAINAPGTSSQNYGAAYVLAVERVLDTAKTVAVCPPIFRVRDNDSMFGTSYNDSTPIRVETVYQFATQ